MSTEDNPSCCEFLIALSNLLQLFSDGSPLPLSYGLSPSALLFMPFDNLCKFLSEKYPDRFAQWLLGEMPTSVEILKTELSLEPIRADSITFLKTQDRILHIEFQVQVLTDPPLPLRMLDYWVRLHRLYRLPITQVLVLLKQPKAGTVIETEFHLEQTRQRYRVVCMWEESPEVFLQDPALIPLAVLAQSENPEQLLTQVSQRLDMIESPGQRQEAATCSQVLARLRFKKELIQGLFRERIMRESVIYQDILQEGREEGRREGRQEGRQEGETALILRQLTRRLGTIAVPPDVQERVRGLSITQIEDLAEALLDFSHPTDLMNWLEGHPSS
jgi:predicted transposase/invertase (TIGR01784 family)